MHRVQMFSSFRSPPHGQFMDIEKLVKAYKKEKDRSVADRMLLIIFIQRDEMSVTGAARRLNKARSWGVKWHRRYLEEEQTDCATGPGQADRRRSTRAS